MPARAPDVWSLGSRTIILDADEYEHRFARMIGELRDRRIDGSRAEILATLTPLMSEGIVSAADWRRLTRQLGLA